jgi:Tfp pilus assembly protein PilV
MSGSNPAKKQRGATLVVAMVMLLLLMVMVGSAYTLSGSNLKAVGNMQFRNEAIAAANVGIERVLSSAVTAAPTAEQLNVDINNDGTSDYLVSMATPTCQRATLSPSSVPSSLNLPGMTSNNWNTVWDLDANVSDPVSGSAVRVRSGVRVLLTDAQKNIVCP